MSVALALLLLQLGPAVPTPTPGAGASMGRSTPVPAGGSLQDLARRRRGFAPEDGAKGAFTAVSPIDMVRTERVAGRPWMNGLLVTGDVVNDGYDLEVGVVEVSAMRRDGTIAQGLVSFGQLSGRDRKAFSRELTAPTRSADPRSLRFETAGARIHLVPKTHRWLPEGEEYLETVACLSYWGKPVFNDKAKEFDQVEVHVQSSCQQAVPAVKTWFYLRVQADPTIESWTDNTLGLFLQAVSPHGELTQLVPAKVKKDMRVRVEAWRP